MSPTNTAVEVEHDGNRYRIRLLDKEPDWYLYEVAEIGRNNRHRVSIETECEEDGYLFSTCSCDSDNCHHSKLAIECGYLGNRGQSPWRELLSQAQRRLPAGDKFIPEIAGIRDTRLAVTYVIDAARSSFSDGVRIELYSQKLNRNGQYGQFRRFSMREHRDDAIRPDDLAILRYLSGTRSRDDEFYVPFRRETTYTVCPSEIGTFTERAAATGRLCWSIGPWHPSELSSNLCPVAWDGEELYEFDFSIEKNDNSWLLSGQLVGDGRTIAAGDLVCIFDEGYALTTDRMVRVKNDNRNAWLTLFQQHQQINVPLSDTDQLRAQLAVLDGVDSLSLPDELRPQLVEVEPQARLSVSVSQTKATRQIRGRIEFVYDDHDVSIRDRRQSVAVHGKTIVRNADKETKLLQALNEFEVRWLEEQYLDEADVYFADATFPVICSRLIKEGWSVVAAGKKVRTAGKMSLNVKSEIDWFELTGNVDFNGVSVSLPELLRAVKEQKQYIELGDGSHGMLPEEWLRSYAGLSSLGKVEGESVKFINSQALLLDALLAEQDNVAFDERFREARDRLRSYQGITPMQEPQGFRGTLRSYQREGLGWLRFLEEFGFGGCLADDMGLGKTVQVLALLEWRRTCRLSSDESRQPSLIVVPKSLVFNWIDEAQRFAPKLKILNYTGSQRHQMKGSFSDYHIVLTTYGLVRRDITELREVTWDFAILDEAQAIKNAKAQSAKACQILKAKNRLAMTGTPIENHLGDLWSIFEFLNPGILGASRIFSSMSKSSTIDLDQTTKLLGKALQPFILRRTKKQVLKDLPEKTEQTILCEMDKSQQKVYDELRDYYRGNLRERVKEKGLNRTKIHVLEALLRLRQAACHPALLDNTKASSAKFDALMKVIEEVTEEGHKALIFSQFTSLLALLREKLDASKIRYEYLDGRTRKRAERVKEFQENPDIPLFLISLKAGGHGLNLTAADYVFILDPWWNPAVESQAIDRAHRIGQTKPVFAYRLICKDTIEEKIIELQKKKRELADAIVKADKSFMQQLSVDDLELLLS